MISDIDQLLKGCQAGDELAWEQLVRSFQPRVFSICWHFLGNSEEARDAAQEVFLKAYRNLSHCRQSEMFLPWLIRISRNTCIDLLRRKSVRPQTEGPAIEEFHELPASEPDPEQSCLDRSRRDLLHKALRQLTEFNREMVILKEIHGLALDQIARLLKIPLGTVKSRSNRARLELAEKVLALCPGQAPLSPPGPEEKP